MTRGRARHWIVTTRDVRIDRCHVHASELARKASDHLPLWADVSIAAPGRHRPPERRPGVAETVDEEAP